MDQPREPKNPFLLTKTIRRISSFLEAKELMSLRLLSRAWNQYLCTLIGPSPLLCLKDVPAVTSFMTVMRNTKSFTFPEVILAADTADPVVVEFMARFGRQFRILAVADWNVEMPFLRNLFFQQVMFIKLLSICLRAEKFDGLSFDFISGPGFPILPILPCLIGLCVDTVGGKADLTQLTQHFLKMTPIMQNLALNLKPVHAPSLSEILGSTKDDITKLFLGWDLNEEEVNALVNTKWKLTDLRLPLRNKNIFSSMAFHAVLDRFNESLVRISNFNLALIVPNEVPVRADEPWFRIYTVPDNLKLRCVELENVIMDPCVFHTLEHLKTLKLRPHSWGNVMEILGPGVISESVLNFYIEGLDCIEEAMAEQLVQRISTAFPGLKSLTIPISDTVFIMICLYLRDLEELVMEGRLTDEAVTGFTPAVIRRFSEGLGDTGDSEDVQLMRDAAQRRPGNVTDLLHLKRFGLTNEATGHDHAGFTNVGMQYGLLECPHLLYIDI